jgi:hypothetical protein
MNIHFKKGTYTINALETIREFAKASNSVIVHGPGLSKKNEAFAFSSETEFRTWIRKQNIGKQLEPLFKQLAKARAEATTDLAFVKKRQLAKAERIEEDLRLLANETGLKYGSKELFLRATRDSRILEGQVFDPVLLYTGANFIGNSIGASTPLPDLTWWPGMNNSITSVQLLGACILYRETYFRGSSLWLLGVPYFQAASLAGTGFNNATSSVYAYVY